jgi:hypothetical protein
MTCCEIRQLTTASFGRKIPANSGCPFLPVLALDGPEVAQFLEVTQAFFGTVLAGLIEFSEGEWRRS